MFVTIDQAVAKLKAGGVVVFPTETVYGLGAIATNAQAVDKVYQIKNRPRDNPLICHFFSLDQIEQYAQLNPLTKFLLTQFSPGPLSVLIDIPTDSPLLPATCGRPTMVARIPNHPLTLELIAKLNEPLAGPSANTSGKFSGTNPEMILQDLGDKIDGILDGGQCQIGLESTILDARNNSSLVILRQGAIGSRELKAVLSTTPFAQTPIYLPESQKTTMVTPGSKYKHYAPRTPLICLHNYEELKHLPVQQTILFGGSLAEYHTLQANHQVLFLGETIVQISHNFYRCLYDLDQLKVPQAWLWIPILDESSLGRSLRDKIEKITNTL